jgi:transcriptional regulator with XRE-family HTH domain
MSTPPPTTITPAVLGDRLRQARAAAGFSQQYVADLTGLPRSGLSDIERGERRVDALELAVLATVYGQPVDHLLGDAPAAATGPEALAARLEQITRDLDGYLERRAWEIAESHIQRAHEAARELVTQAQRQEQRQRDLVDELRRQYNAAVRRAQRAEHTTGFNHAGREQCPECDVPRKTPSNTATTSSDGAR